MTIIQLIKCKRHVRVVILNVRVGDF